LLFRAEFGVLTRRYYNIIVTRGRSEIRDDDPYTTVVDMTRHHQVSCGRRYVIISVCACAYGTHCDDEYFMYDIRARVRRTMNPRRCGERGFPARNNNNNNNRKRKRGKKINIVFVRGLVDVARAGDTQ